MSMKAPLVFEVDFHAEIFIRSSPGTEQSETSEKISVASLLICEERAMFKSSCTSSKVRLPLYKVCLVAFEHIVWQENVTFGCVQERLKLCNYLFEFVFIQF